MFELFILALLSFNTPAASTSAIGSGGWGHDVNSTTSPTIGSGGWGHDVNSTTSPTIGSGGWGHDVN